VVDLTWRTDEPNHKGRLRDRIIGVIPNGWWYMGSRFDDEMLRERVITKGAVWAVLGNYGDNFPHLSGERKSA
jgi:hypothetical protein